MAQELQEEVIERDREREFGFGGMWVWKLEKEKWEKIKGNG